MCAFSSQSEPKESHSHLSSICSSLGLYIATIVLDHNDACDCTSAVMPAVSPLACLWCVLFSVVLSLDLKLAYVTQKSLYYYSCTHDLPPCSVSSLCSCEDLQLSMLHRDPLHSSPAFQETQLIVWYTSASDIVQVLNNSEVKNLTLIHCGAGGPKETPIPKKYFAVLQLERLTVVNLQRGPILEENKARNTDLETENGADLSTFTYNRVTDINQDFNTELRQEFVELFPPHIHDILLGREIGAVYHEQARLGVIYSSVLEPGAKVKAYTVLTRIDSEGLLPFPDLHLPRLQETSTVYVSFVY